MAKAVIPEVNIFKHLPKKGVVMVPTYYLTGKKAIALDRMVAKALKEHAEGKTIKAGSLKEALAIYNKKNRDRRRV